jgi:hypothetical protein
MDQVTLLPGAAFDYDMPCALRVARDRCWDDPLCGWCADLTAPQENQTRFAGKCYQACQWIWDASTATSGVGGLNTFDPELDGRCPIQHQKEWQLRPDGTTCMIADAVQGYMTMVTLLTVLFFVRAILEFVGSFSCCSACSCCAPSGMGKGTSATAKPGDGALAIKTRRLFILCWILTHSLLYASLVRYQVSNRSQHRPQDVISAIALLLQARNILSLSLFLSDCVSCSMDRYCSGRWAHRNTFRPWPSTWWDWCGACSCMPRAPFSNTSPSSAR